VKPKPRFERLYRIAARVQSARRILLALDYDAALAPVAVTPEQAEMPADAAEILSAMSRIDGVSIVVVSGRSLLDLRRQIAFRAALIANHGLEIETRELSFVHPAASAARSDVEQACWDLRQAFDGVGSIRVGNKDLSANVDYREAPQELGNWVRDTTKLVLRPYQRVLRCNVEFAMVEIRPRIGWNAGTALRHLLRRTGDAGTLVICAGDDRADQHLFGAASLNYRLRSPAALMSFLRTILDRVEVRAHQPYRLGPTLAGAGGNVPALQISRRSGA
jgi:trehalose-phosphatase